MTISTQTTPSETTTGGCPFHHTSAQRKTFAPVHSEAPAIERDASGTWHVRSFAAARAVLRSPHTQQAGFKAELMDNMGKTMKRPILYQEGKVHHEQRRQTARFFTPRFTSDNYRGLMESLSDEVIQRLQRTGKADLSELSLIMAVSVAARVIGLTSSSLPGMDKRLDFFFSQNETGNRASRALWEIVRTRTALLAFFFLDVKPAIAARRKHLQDDLISHLIRADYNDASILTECITYGAAGMATTREFISVATWHMLEQPKLRERFLVAGEDERQAMLQEILRVEPVVGKLIRHATADIVVEHDGDRVIIPAGDRVVVEVYNANADELLVGEQPHNLCPGRTLQEPRVGPEVMSFGDGHHRCPGSYVALQESDIFLQRLLAIPSLHIVRPPTLKRNELVTGYELRDFIVGV